MSAKDAVDLAGRIAELVKKGATLEAQERIVELRGMVVALSEENISLREELIVLREKESQRNSLRYDKEQEVYFMDKADDKGPYCQHCWDKDRRLAHLRGFDHWSGYWHCSVCDKSFGPEKKSSDIDPDRPVSW